MQSNNARKEFFSASLPTPTDSLSKRFDRFKALGRLSFKTSKERHESQQNPAKITYSTSMQSTGAVGKRLARTDSFPSTSNYKDTTNISSQRHTINMATKPTAENRLSRTDSTPSTSSYKPKHSDALLQQANIVYKIHNNTQKEVSGPALNDDLYKMNHTYRGRVLIFSHTNFSDDLDSREGSEKDVINLKKQLPRLGYHDISICHDYSFSDIAKTLVEYSSMDYTNYDSFMLFVLTHGDSNDKIYAKDTEYSVEKLWRHFLGDRCPSLTGKPKIFFVIACRGNSTDPGVKVVSKRKISTSTDAVENTYKQSYTIPIHADILTVYSTTPGYFSYREDLRGTWYIDVFCQELKKLLHKEEINFIDFLTKVNLKISTAKTTYNPDDFSMDKKKQCSSFTSTLLRKIVIEVGEPT